MGYVIGAVVLFAIGAVMAAADVSFVYLLLVMAGWALVRWLLIRRTQQRAVVAEQQT